MKIDVTFSLNRLDVLLLKLLPFLWQKVAKGGTRRRRTTAMRKADISEVRP